VLLDEQNELRLAVRSSTRGREDAISAMREQARRHFHPDSFTEHLEQEHEAPSADRNGQFIISRLFGRVVSKAAASK
jgi:hypothetical protein